MTDTPRKAPLMRPVFELLCYAVAIALLLIATSVLRESGHRLVALAFAIGFLPLFGRALTQVGGP